MLQGHIYIFIKKHPENVQIYKSAVLPKSLYQVQICEFVKINKSLQYFKVKVISEREGKSYLNNISVLICLDRTKQVDHNDYLQSSQI